MLRYNFKIVYKLDYENNVTNVLSWNPKFMEELQAISTT